MDTISVVRLLIERFIIFADAVNNIRPLIVLNSDKNAINSCVTNLVTNYVWTEEWKGLVTNLVTNFAIFRN